MPDLARRAPALAFGLGLLLLTGCATAPQPAIEYPDYYIGAPDVLEVRILPEPRVEQELVVRNDGKITVELLGDVQAGGRTTQQVAEEIETRIGRYKRGAVVTVAVAKTASPTITVLGEVRQPGSFPLTRQMRVAEVIGMVGDTTLFSSPGKIRVIRGGEDETRVIEVDLWDIRHGDLTTNVQLQAGDVVYVPSSVLARIGYGIQILLFPLQPVLGFGMSSLANVVVP